MKKSNKVLNIITKIFIGLIVALVFGLIIYSLNYYHVSEGMYEEIETLDVSEITRYEDNDEISFDVVNPQKNIIIIPGGKVDSLAYEYLAYNLALDGNNVTIYKPFLHLAVIFPNTASKFIDEDLENIIIGHSLGGVVSSIIASNRDEISGVVLLASYSTRDLSDKEVLLITGENDSVMLKADYEDSKPYYDHYTEFEIAGGNHAQFGWYGAQEGDGIPTISVKEQQDIVVNEILEFIH